MANKKRRIDYPRSGRNGVTRFIPSWRQFFSGLGLLILAGLAFVTLSYFFMPIPQPNQFASSQTTVVYYDDGSTEMGRFASQNRVLVKSDEIPQSMKDAVVAAEDRTFYENRGVSPTGVLRAVVNNVRGESTHGGSTITQQYVKNYYLNSERTLTRKYREAIIALKIDQEQSKDEILTNYLNTIYYGRGAYGIETAAQAYFGKSAKDLTPQESAMLAGLIPNPSRWDPRVSPDLAKDRFDYVADSMVIEGTLTKAQRDTWTLPETVERDKKDNLYAGPKGYLLAQVRTELQAAGLTDSDLDGGGLKIVTTINKDDQDAAEAMIDNPNVYPTRGRPENLQAAVVSVDPRSGEIKALYGGADYLTRQRNAATQDIAQAGSTFKPFALVAGLESGISLRSGFNGNSPLRVQGSRISNFGGASYGIVTLLKATQSSINTAYVALNVRVGPEKTRDVAVRAGLPADTAGLNDYPGNVLGPSSPHPIDMANAFATFASRGERHTPHIVRTVARPSGATVYTGPTGGERVFEQDVMDDTNYALQQVVSGGTGRRASIGRPVAGKTGTSSDNMSAWFVGYTPQLSTAVVLFNTDDEGNPQSIGSFGGRGEITGGTFPAAMWSNYMRAAMQGEPVERFAKPANVGKRIGPRVTRKKTSTSTPKPTRSTTSTPTETETTTPPTETAPPPTEAPPPETAPQPTSESPAPAPEPTPAPPPAPAPAPAAEPTPPAAPAAVPTG